MVIFDANKNLLKIIIPGADETDLLRYREGLLSILQKVTIDNCDLNFREQLKAVYEILGHMENS